MVLQIFSTLFHSLYDADVKGKTPTGLDWYATPELACVIALRNARHHNESNKIRSLFTYHARTQSSPSLTHEYLLLDFKDTEIGAQHIEYFFSWEDFHSFLQSSTNRLRKSAISHINSYLATDQYSKHCTENELNDSDLFINGIPIVLNAGIAVLPHIKDSVNHDLSTESQFFSDHFQSLLPLNTSDHVIDKIKLSLPG